MRYKALLIDVDGTLIPNQLAGLPSKKVIAAVKSAGEYMHVGVATARPLSALTEIFEKLPLSGPSVINGGAQVIDLPSEEILWERTMNPEDIEKVVRILQKYTKNFLIFDNEEDIEYSESYKPIRPLQIYAQALDPQIADAIIEDLSGLSGTSEHSVVSWAKGMRDIVINHAEATKQHGVFEVAKILGIETHEIIGIGDGYNDFPLLMACGLKVAMGNAPEDLKAIADYVAPPVDQDGVADVIERFVLSQGEGK